MPIAVGLLASALPALGEYFGKKFRFSAGEIQLSGQTTMLERNPTPKYCASITRMALPSLYLQRTRLGPDAHQ
jgi:hypothetical protein